jgi:hypothetical protein
VTWLAIASVLVGLVVIVASSRPRAAAVTASLGTEEWRQAMNRNGHATAVRLARRLELAHNLAGRLLRTRWHPTSWDLEYVAAGAVGTYQRAGVIERPMVRLVEIAQLIDPLLELEELLERLEAFGARVRSWRPGRARGKR